MAAINYRIRVVKPDFEFEAEGDKAFVLQMLDRFGGSAPGATPRGRAKASKAEDAGAINISASGKSLSIGEFIRQTGLKKHTDKVLAFGYYLEKFAGATAFSAADINSCYYDAKMESSNTSQMIIHNIKSGRMMVAKKPKGGKGRKVYLLTRTGEELIEEKLAEKQD